MKTKHTLAELAEIGRAAIPACPPQTLIQLAPTDAEAFQSRDYRDKYLTSILKAVGVEPAAEEPEREAYRLWCRDNRKLPSDDGYEIWKAAQELVTNPWIPWHGSNSSGPSVINFQCEVRLRSGAQLTAHPARAYGDWRHCGSGGDIVAYRIIK